MLTIPYTIIGRYYLSFNVTVKEVGGNEEPKWEEKYFVPFFGTESDHVGFLFSY